MNANTNNATVTELPQAKIDFNELEKVCGNTLFPDVFQPNEVQIPRRKNRHQDCILSDKNYVPDEKILRRVLAWWLAPQVQPLGLTGETGTGKTELLLHIADKLNEPVYIVKTHGGMMPEDLEGSKELVQGESGVITQNKLGPVAKAYAKGGLVIFDEADKGNSALHCAMHGLVEGKPWPVEQFGITINKHSMCRITATANTTGEGGHERYHTSQRMDAALRSRFGWLKTNYPDMATELDILTRKFPKIPTSMAREMVTLANNMRDAALGKDREGEGDINAVFSTRTIVNWGHYTMAFGLNASWRESLDFAFGGSVDPESKDEVEAIIQRTLADKIDLTVKDLITEYAAPKKP